MTGCMQIRHIICLSFTEKTYPREQGMRTVFEGGGNKASNEHLTKSYTKPQLALSPRLPSFTHAHTCSSHAYAMEEKEERANVEKEGTLAFAEKGLHRCCRLWQSHFPPHTSLTPVRNRCVQLFSKVVVVSAFSLFSSAPTLFTHLY
jgi:hypothetical protein